MKKVNAKPETAVERLDRLELTLHRELERVSRDLETTSGLLQAVAESFQATLAVMKDADPTLQDKLKAKVMHFAVDRARADLAKREQEVAQAVERKQLVPVTTVTENCYLALAEYDADGNKKEPGKAFAAFANLTDKAKAELLGKELLYSTEVDGVKVEVLEIYQFAPPPEDRPSVQ